MLNGVCSAYSLSSSGLCAVGAAEEVTTSEYQCTCMCLYMCLYVQCSLALGVGWEAYETGAYFRCYVFYVCVTNNVLISDCCADLSVFVSVTVLWNRYFENPCVGSHRFVKLLLQSV